MEAVQNPGRHDVPINKLELGGKALLGAHAPCKKKAAWWQKNEGQSQGWQTGPRAARSVQAHAEV